MFANLKIAQDRKDGVLTLLIHLGYLAYDADAKRVFMPNEKVRQEFVRAVTTGRHQEIAKLVRNSDILLEQTLNMDEFMKGNELASGIGYADVVYIPKSGRRCAFDWGLL